MDRRRARWLGIAVGIPLALALGPRPGSGAEPIEFSSPPTDIGNVAGVVPQGNTNPRGDHVLPVDHMYLEFPDPDNGGADSYPVYAMADGEVVFIQRVQDPGKADPDYQIFIRHDKKLTSYYDHVNGLSTRIQDHIDAAAGDPWLVPVPDFELLLLGQGDAPEPLPVTAGETLGVVKSYSFSWDVGVIDGAVKHRLAGSRKRRYPDLRTVLKVFGFKVKAPHKGHEIANGTCFLDYLSPALQPAWKALLVSTPQECGSHAWDRKGTLQGAWFNPELGKTDFFEIESGALAIGPDNYSPGDRIQISMGAGTSFSAFDPADALDQLDRAFLVDFDPAPGARINPDPAQVTKHSGTVCYELEYEDAGTRYNTLLLHMVASKKLAIDFDPTPNLVPSCPGVLPEPDETWTAIYVR